MTERKKRDEIKNWSWSDQYQAKLCSATDAAALVKDNDIIGLGGGGCIPAVLEEHTGAGQSPYSHSPSRL